MALIHSPPLEFGKPCPEFNLPSLTGGSYSLSAIPKNTPFVVMFVCNHCPYVQAIEDRLITLGRDLAKLKIPVVAICSNDGESYPEDSFENLRKNYIQKEMGFVYLHDPSQRVAQDFGAVCTPDFFVYDRQHLLAYRGRLDDSWKDPNQVTRRELFEAVLKLSQGLPPPAPQEQVSSMGCSIKWIKK